jgi:hypothetical protein
VARLTTSGAPHTILVDPINDSITTISVLSQNNFPARAKFMIAIDSELLLVTAKPYTPGVAVWTVVRGQQFTSPASHNVGATVTLADAYGWNEQDPPPTGNDTWTPRVGGRFGLFTAFPARERNQNCFVPDMSYVRLEKKTTDGIGATTTYAPAGPDLVMSPTDTSLPVADGTSFPEIYPFAIRVGPEIMLVVGGGGTGQVTFTVVRGQYGTQAVEHPLGPNIRSDVVETICEWTFDYCCKP